MGEDASVAFSETVTSGDGVLLAFSETVTW
jgi:hypothetical protein